MTFISVSELCRWLGVTVFELWMQVFGCFVFSVLLAIKIEPPLDFSISWWLVFSPLLIVCGLHAYFTLIVFIRQYLDDSSLRTAATRALLLGMLVALLVTFEALLCLSAQSITSSEGYAVTFCPIYVMLALLLVKACLLHS